MIGMRHTVHYDKLIFHMDTNLTSTLVFISTRIRSQHILTLNCNVLIVSTNMELHGGLTKACYSCTPAFQTCFRAMVNIFV